MIYIVTGFMRSGTSMMMAALEAGGIEVFHSVDRAKQLDSKYSDDKYAANNGGYYEPLKADFAQKDFPKMHDGKAIKILYGGMAQLAVFQYKIILMTRHPEEIRQSYEAMFRSRLNDFHEKYESIIAKTSEILDNRRDVEWIKVDYNSLMEDPAAEFNRIKNAGWPIDAEKAAATVDPEQYRFRLEDLTVGI